MKAALADRPPGLAWTILLFYLCSAVYVMFSFYSIHSGVVHLDSQQKAYFNGLGLIDYSISGFLEGINLAGAVFLFLRRKVALYLFGGALIINMLTIILQLLIHNINIVQLIGSSGIAGAVIGWVIMVAVFLYAWRLSQKGILV